MNAYYHDYLKRAEVLRKRGFSINAEIDQILAAAGLEQCRVLDVGAGRGCMAFRLLEKGFDVTTVDVDPEALDFVRGCAQALGYENKLQIKMDDSHNLSFPDNAFDAVLSFNVIHHLTNPEVCIDEMVRVAREKVIIADFNTNGFDIISQLHAQEGRLHERGSFKGKDIQAYLERKGLPFTLTSSTCEHVFVCHKWKLLSPV